MHDCSFPGRALQMTMLRLLSQEGGEVEGNPSRPNVHDLLQIYLIFTSFRSLVIYRSELEFSVKIVDAKIHSP